MRRLRRLALLIAAVLLHSARAQISAELRRTIDEELRSRVVRTGSVTVLGGDYTQVGLPVEVCDASACQIKPVVWDTATDPAAAARAFAASEKLGATNWLYG